jgi:hypothetical protein
VTGIASWISDHAASLVKNEGDSEWGCSSRWGPDYKKWGGDEYKIERQNNEKLREREESSEEGSFMSEGVEGKLRDSVLGR